MVNFQRLSRQAKKVVDKRGGTASLKEDLAELKGVAKGKGSIKEKAKAAGEALKEPGTNAPKNPQDLPPRR